MISINENIKKKIRELRLNHHATVEHIVAETGIAKSSVSKYIRIAESELTKEQRDSLRNKIANGIPGKNVGRGFIDTLEFRLAKAEKECRRLHAIIDEKEVRFPYDAISSTVDKGKSAELLVRYRLSRVGLKAFLPPDQSSALDLLVEGLSGRFYRCEVKGCLHGNHVRLVRTIDVRTNPRQVAYKEDDKIDFFIAVDLSTETLAVIPFSASSQSVRADLSPNGWAWKYVNAYNQFV